MDTRFFLRRLLPQEGYYVLWCNSKKLKRHKQYSFETIDELADAAEQADADGWDAYFAMSNFDEVNTRKAVNSKQIRSFFLDLDCGPSKPHATQADALRDLREFCTVTELPKPLIINSGRGVHVYWPLTEAVSIREWKPVAEAFKALCKTKKFEIDTAVPADAARVLRVLHTHNHKPDPPAPVDLIGKEVEPVNFDFFASKVGVDVITVPTKTVRPEKEKPQEGSAEAFAEFIQNSREYVFKNILSKTKAGKGCEQLRLIMTDQENTTEPMWRAGLSIAKFCADGEKAAHILSKKHPEYVPQLTEEKMELVKGPYRCATFDENNPHVCMECPNWGKIKSPIVLGGQYKEFSSDAPTHTFGDEDATVDSMSELIDETPEEVIPNYPKPYFRGANGGVFYREVNSDGDVDETMVYHNDIYVTRRLVDVEAGEAVVIKLHLPVDGVREFTAPLTALTSREEFRKQMSAVGVAQMDLSGLMKYMTTWVNELQASVVADTAHRQYGWTDDTCAAFVVGDKEITANTISYNPPTVATAQTFPYFEKKGTLEGWRDMANFYMSKEGMEMHQYIVCTAFGSPLMQFLPQNCCTLHMFDKDGGAGKTAAMKVAASVWGHFKACMTGEKDTTAYKMNRGETLHNLPLYIDELTNTEKKYMSDLAYQLTSGEQRGRMSPNSNVERATGRPWKLLCCSTGNMSAIEKISLYKAAPKAEAQRILEHRAQKVFTDSGEKALTDDFERRIEEHYGHAGPIFIQYVISNLEAVKKFLLEVQQKVDRAADLKAENRYWSAGVACSLTGGAIAKKLGLIDYDNEALFRWSVELLERSKTHIQELGGSVQQTLTDYIMENYGSFLWIKSTDDLRKKDAALPQGLAQLVNPDWTPRVRMVGRYETDTKRVYMLTAPLKQWCGERQINYSAFVQELKDKMNGKRTKIRLGTGTPMVTPSVHVVAADCAIDDIDEDGRNQDG